MRYKIAHPVQGGSEYWEITDTKLNYPIITLHRNCPNVEELVKSIMQVLNATSVINA